MNGGNVDVTQNGGNNTIIEYEAASYLAYMLPKATGNKTTTHRTHRTQNAWKESSCCEEIQGAVTFSYLSLKFNVVYDLDVYTHGLWQGVCGMMITVTIWQYDYLES